MDIPEVRYVKTPDGAHLAYQVFGEGSFDLVFVPGFASNVEGNAITPDAQRAKMELVVGVATDVWGHA